MGRFLIWLSGARKKILDECPTDRAKYVGIGTVILITAAMAGVSLTFALVTALKTPLWAALPFALAWAVAILCLDRMFVVSLPREGKWWVHLLRAVPRLLLALLLGFVISAPFVLQIFRPEIEHEITLLHTQAQNAYLKGAKNGKLQQEINQDSATVSQLTTAAGGGGEVKLPPQAAQIKTLRAQRNRAQGLQNRYYNAWQCQLYGTAPNGKVCHNPAGAGPLARADHQNFLREQSQVQQLNREISTDQRIVSQGIKRQQRVEAGKARSQLPAARAALAAAQAERKHDLSTFNTQNNNNGGLLIRLQALGEVTDRNSTLNTARWLLFALFVAIDCMPVLIKVMLNLGPENNYDRMLKAEEEKQLKVAASNRALRAAAERMAAETVIGEAQSRLQGWSAPIPGVTQNIVATRERVEAKKLRAWENAQNLRLINGNGSPPHQTPASTQPPIGFIAWPDPADPAGPAPGWAPLRRLRGLGQRIGQWIGGALPRWRTAPPRHGSPAGGQQPYGAPYAPRQPRPANQAGRSRP
jgi:hypothetical protein